MERTLSHNEAKVVLDLEWKGQKTVTLAEIRETLGASDSYARFLTHRLVKKGWLERLRPGLYQLVPAARGREGVPDLHPLTAGAALTSPYFFSFGTACTHHGLTDQTFAEVYLACLERRRPEFIRGKRYVFIAFPQRLFFGFKETPVLGQPVQMAPLERALLDAIARPQYAGGLGEVSRIAARAAGRVSWERLLEFAERWKESALVQRLGYWLDLHQAAVPPEIREGLIGLTRPNSKIMLGPRRRWGTSGALVRPWNIIENVPREVLVSKEEKTRRRVTFSRPETSQ